MTNTTEYAVPVPDDGTYSELDDAIAEMSKENKRLYDANDESWWESTAELIALKQYRDSLAAY
jgi:hypothetical protein